MRGATVEVPTDCVESLHFNPRSPCGERPAVPAAAQAAQLYFNPRSPCGERRELGLNPMWLLDFNPRSPCGERPISIDFPGRKMYWISIHAPHAGSDNVFYRGVLPHSHFNPRSPCGERPRYELRKERENEFQSTLPMRGATESCLKELIRI